MSKKNIICTISLKGGVGKTTLAYHLCSYLLKDTDFEIIEIDNNNETSKELSKSKLLKEKIQSVNITEGADKLEKLVIDLVFDEHKKVVIDAGGGDDTKKVIQMLQKENLIDNTLFVIPYMPDYLQLETLLKTLALIKDNDYVVTLNNYFGGIQSPFLSGNKDLLIPDPKKIFKNFFVVPSSIHYSYAVANGRETIYDLATMAVEFKNQQEVIDFVKSKSEDKDEVLSAYRKWKVSKEALDYLESKEINDFKEFMASQIGI